MTLWAWFWLAVVLLLAAPLGLAVYGALIWRRAVRDAED